MKTRVAISAGHNMHAKGACHEGRCEWPETRIWAELVAQLLSSQFSVILAPEEKLGGKVRAINAYKAELAVEIHFNAGGSATTKGCETLHFPDSANGIKLARLMQKHLVPAMETKDRGIKEGWLRQDVPGQVDFDGDVNGDESLLYFLKETACPAVIVEPEFVYHFASIEAHRLAGAKAIAQAVVDYFAGEEVQVETDDEEPPVRAAMSSRGKKSKRFPESPED